MVVDPSAVRQGRAGSQRPQRDEMHQSGGQRRNWFWNSPRRLCKNDGVRVVLLAERRIQLKHANPIGWACLGIAKSYLGNPEAGFHHTLLPRVIADRHRSGIRSTRWAALRRDVVAGGTGL